MKFISNVHPQSGPDSLSACFLRAMSGLFLFVFLTGQLQALPVEDLYQHEVPVQNQSDAERNRAYREALEAVVLKLTGEPRWIEQGAVQRALAGAGSYVQEVGFRTASGQTLIIVSFSPAQINDLLSDAGIPIWDRNRPSVLVWLTIQDIDGRRSMLSSDSEDELLNFIEAFSQRRAVPFLIPLLDLTDRRNLSLDQAWALDQEAITEASARYGADSILSGRLLTTPGGELVGLWQFQFRGETEVFDGFDRDMQSYLRMPLERVVAKLAAHFNVVRSADQSQQSVSLKVRDVKSIAAYAGLLEYLESLSMVSSVKLRHLQAGQLELDVLIWGNASQLGEFLNLDRDLRAIAPEQETAGDSNTLYYQWTP